MLNDRRMKREKEERLYDKIMKEKVEIYKNERKSFKIITQKILSKI